MAKTGHRFGRGEMFYIDAPSGTKRLARVVARKRGLGLVRVVLWNARVGKWRNHSQLVHSSFFRTRFDGAPSFAVVDA
jgi:hypothetical protein